MTPPSPERVAAALKSVLSRPEFQKRGPSLIERFREWLYEILRKLGFHWDTPSLGSSGAKTTQLIVLGLAILGFLFLILYVARRLDRRLRRETVAPAEAFTAADATASALLRDADACAERGEYREALERLMVGTLLHLRDAKAMEYRPNRTNWENLRVLSRDFPPVAARHLRTTAHLFDRKWYGVQEVDLGEYRAAASDLAEARAAADALNATHVLQGAEARA